MSIELLSPVGDSERLKAAVLYKADAVYVGATQFGMRAAPQNFTFEQLAEGVSFAHENNVKIFLTVNGLPRSNEVDELPEFLKQAYQTGVDALIIADIGIIDLAKSVVPNVEIHASTQTGIVNHLTATSLYNMGVSRVVLARELDFDEIRTIRAKTPKGLELEAFVHGAMCMSVSGRCVISNYLTGRDANRGECSQPCRWNYHLVEEKRPGIYLPIDENESGTTILNAKDLCMIEDLKDVIDAGITSLKIEGRAKSAYYTSVVTNAYRAALDAVINNQPFPTWASDELDKISHREYSKGFYYGREPIAQSYYKGGYIQNWEVSAIINGYDDGHLVVLEKNKFSVGDTLEVMSPGKPPDILLITAIKTLDGEYVDIANRPLVTYLIPCDTPYIKGSVLRRQRVD